MTYTLADYDRCLDDLCSACDDLGDRVVSVLLCGSMAIGSVRPGHSDVLDALVVLDDKVLDERREFSRVILRLRRASKKIKSRGLPFHPFHYYFQSELNGWYPYAFEPQWHDDGFSAVSAGADTRYLIRCDPTVADISRGMFYVQRLSTQRLAYFIRNPEALRQRRSMAYKKLCQFARISPRLACVMLGTNVVEQQMVDALRGLLPDFDFDGLERIRAFCKSFLADAPEDVFLASMREALELNERLHDCVVTKLKLQGVDHVRCFPLRCS